MNLRSERRAVGRIVAAMTLAVIVALSGIAANPSANALQLSPARQGRTSLLDMGMGMASILPPAFWEAIGQPQSIDDGPDDVLNVLLLGSDTRAGGISRTDTIMVVSLKNNVVRAASIPRDTARIPNPFTQANSTDTYTGRVNTILKTLKSGDTVEHALTEFEFVIEELLQIKIDYHALITFAGFHAMVDVIDPISIDYEGNPRQQVLGRPEQAQGRLLPGSSNYELWAFQPESPAGCATACGRRRASPIRACGATGLCRTCAAARDRATATSSVRLASRSLSSRRSGT